MPTDNLNFYRAFEDRHRGSRELIKSRLQVYIPLVLPLLDIYKECKTLDLGCGRGEWLELLTDNGFQAFGVDLDSGMLAACDERGLQVSKKDAITALRELPDESQSIVSGFHIAEHLPFDVLSILVQEALRVLKPGGLLILETPNPENIQVATMNFYLDPTHQRPIPPQLLTFMAEFYGFSRVKVLRLQEPKELYENRGIHLIDVIGGVSPDYAVIAQKRASSEILTLFSEYFNRDVGISLDALAGSFEQRLSVIEVNAQQAVLQSEQARALAIASASHAESAEARAIESVSHAENAEARAIEAELHAERAAKRSIEAELYAERAQSSAVEAESHSEQSVARAIEAESRAHQAEINANLAWDHYGMIANSRSWRVTYPLRLAGKAARWFVHGSIAWITFSPASRPRRILRTFLIFMKRKVKENYKLKSFAVRVLARFPTLKERLMRVGEASFYTRENKGSSLEDMTLNHLNSNAKRIYVDLKVAIQKNKEGH